MTTTFMKLEDQEAFFDTIFDDASFLSRKKELSHAKPLLWVALWTNVMLFCMTAFWAVSTYRIPPVHDQVQIDIVHKQINGTLVDIDHSLFRAPPSPDVDAAWARIGSLAPHVISTEDVRRLGKDPDVTARFSEDWGFGTEAHAAEVDILHVIHCLNAIRRDVHWKHYFGKRYPTGDFPELHRVHTDHCIYSVLQTLMCGATADLVTQAWAEGQLHPFPDFSINKRCRNFDAILDWHERTSISDMNRYGQMIVPDGWQPLPMFAEFHRLFGTYDVDE